MMSLSPISLLGAGAWGTTVGNILAKKGHEIRFWDHNNQVEHSIVSHHINDPYLPGIELSPNFLPSKTLSEHIQNCSLLILAVPSKFLVPTLQEILPFLHSNLHILALTKGLMFEEKPLLVSDIIQKYLGNIPLSRIAVLSGPNFASEIAREMPAATVVAGRDSEFLLSLQNLLTVSHLRVYTNTDLLGVQLGGMMKNVIALSAGILDGANLGMNLKSALLVRGVAEMSRVFSAMGACPQTLYGLSGLGDLIATSMSELSRNHWAGLQIGKGLTLLELSSYGRTVEGIETLKPLLKLAEMYQVELPICQQTYDIIFNSKPVLGAIEDLMKRTLKAE
jgi:glycerol-3-phosphate dehydrogenase (NAD(P)+)